MGRAIAARAVQDVPPRRPMASAHRVSLFSRRIEIRLSAAAIDILFEGAGVLSEGSVDAGRYYGSTMVTFELDSAAELVREACDAATLKRVSELLAGDDRIRERARRLAVSEAERAAQSTLLTPQVDLRVSTSGNHLHLDVDVEAQVTRT